MNIADIKKAIQEDIAAHLANMLDSTLPEIHRERKDRADELRSFGYRLGILTENEALETEKYINTCWRQLYSSEWDWRNAMKRTL